MKSTAILFLFMTFCTLVSAQAPKYQLVAVGTNPVSQKTVVTAKTISDINPGFPSTWIKTYKSLSVSTIDVDGTTMTASGQGAMLNGAQQSLLKRAAIGDEIQFEALYIPAGEEKREEREIEFAVTVCPSIYATYAEGEKALETYMIDNLQQLGTTATLGTATVVFTIADDGMVTDVELEKASPNSSLNLLLLSIVQGMPAWTPAKTADDKHVAQKFALSVGDMIGC